jgi:hypothetical protein
LLLRVRVLRLPENFAVRGAGEGADDCHDELLCLDRDRPMRP